MRELFKEFKDNEIKIEVQKEQDQKKEIKLIGSQIRKPGLTLFEFNSLTKKLSRAKFKTDETLEVKSLSVSPESLTKRKSVIINDNCIYFQCLNERSARKKLGL